MIIKLQNVIGCVPFSIPKADDHVNLHNYCMHLWSEWNEKMGGIHAR